MFTTVHRNFLHHIVSFSLREKQQKSCHGTTLSSCFFPALLSHPSDQLVLSCMLLMMPSSHVDPSTTEESSLATKSQHRQLVPNLSSETSSSKRPNGIHHTTHQTLKEQIFNLHSPFTPAITCKYLMVSIFLMGPLDSLDSKTVLILTLILCIPVSKPE